LAPPPTPQRAWRSACPNCGAPVDFASAASASAVCGYCRSTLVRDGDALRRIGTSAELFDDHSPLQIGTAGRYQGLAFTLVGRLQVGTESGPWNEWHALFGQGSDPQRAGWLSEDNGAYVFAFDAAPPADAPAPASLRAGQALQIGGIAWSVASSVRAHLIAAQGELPSPPRLDGQFTVADLRNAQGDVATLDDSDPARLHWSVGRAVALSALALNGLRDDAQATEKTLSSRSLACPNCGAALMLTLASTQSVSCGQCHAVVDVSQGAGADLQHYAQSHAGVDGAQPQIPLGSSGRLALDGEALPWQVVGYQERCTVADNTVDADDGDGSEQTFWREYLLYNRSAGFAFLVDAEDGWSWVKPITGAPEHRGERARWLGADYRQRERYRAKVTWVLGEFYWRVRRGEVAVVTDFEGTGAHGTRRLSREQAGSAVDSEVTWSAGEVLAAQAVAEAFGMAPSSRAALQRDVAPTSGPGGGSLKGLALFVAMAVVMLVLVRCSGDDCDDVRDTFGAASTEYRQCTGGGGAVGGPRYGGGSYGGYSSGGGGHK
jgi:ribosomal protein S27AE